MTDRVTPKRSIPLTKICVAALIMAMAAVVLASPKMAVALELSDQEMQRLEELIASAIELQSEGDHRAALRKYRRAASISDHPRIQLEKAVSYRELGNCERAWDVYVRLLERDELDSALADEAREEMENLESCLDRGDLVIQCTPVDRDVHLSFADDAPQMKEGVCPIRWTLAPGQYVLQADAEGYASKTERFRVMADERVSLTVELEPEGGVDSDTHWTEYASYGALGGGTLFVALAVMSDRNTGERRQNLSDAYESGDPALIEQWESHNKRVRRRNIGLYGVGTTLLLAGGAGLVWHLVLDDDASSSDPLASRSGWTLGPTSRGVELNLRW